MNLNDLMTSETTIQEPTHSWWLDFNVISAVEEEKKSALDVAREKLTQYLKNRSNLRKDIRSWEKSSWNKDVDNKTVNTSTLADTFTDVMVSLGKDPAYMQERYWTNKWNIELINKMKWLQWGKFSWDIQNYIDGKDTDLTWLVNNMFPDYIAAKTWTPTKVTTETVTTQPVKKEEANVLQWDTRSWWEKMADKITNFQWSDIWLESERKPVKWLMNVLWGFVDTTQKIIPWTMDIINQLTMTSPEKFNQYLDEWYYMQGWVKTNAKEAYERDVKYRWYKWSYNQWVDDIKTSYEHLYNQSEAKSIDESRGDYWFNTMDTDSLEFKAWWLGSEVVQQLVLDKWLASAFNKWVDLYKWYKAAKWSKDVVKWTELATRWTELALEWTEGLTNPQTMQESKNIANRIIDWFNKWGKTQDLVKAWAEWWKAWLEYQLIWDVQEGKLSDAQAYWISAWLGSVLWTIFSALSKWWEFISEPKKQLQTSLSRIWWKDTTQILDWAEASAKDWTLPSALQKTTDMAVKEAKENVKKNLDKAWKDLWGFRKSLWQSDLTVSDFSKTINKWLTDKWIWAKIVEKDGKYIIEWYPWEYGDVLNKIVERMNSAVENVKNKYELYKAWEQVDFWTNTKLFEDLLSDLKSFSVKEANAEVKQKFIEIENDLLDNLKWSMSDAQWGTYKWYLDKYSKLKTRYKKVLELEWKMNNKGVIDQPKLEDWQYLSDFLNELTADWTISNNAADRRIAAIYADAFYWWPVKDTDKLIYPSVPWVMEWFMKLVVQTLRNPRSKITWWWGKYATDYKPSATRSALNKWAKQAKTTTIWKMAEQPREE